MEAENAEIIIVDEEKGLGDHEEDVSIKSSRENEAQEDENEGENQDQMENSSKSSDNVKGNAAGSPHYHTVTKCYLEKRAEGKTSLNSFQRANQSRWI